MVLKDIDTEGAYANIALHRLLEEFRPGRLDRAFVTEIVYGTMRTLNTLDWILQQHIKQSLDKQTPWIRNILRLGVYQMFYLSRVPAPAAINEAANQARRFGHPGAVKFVNGVLRNILRRKNEINFPDINKDQVKHISLKYYHPDWLVERWIEILGVEETIALCMANNKTPPVTVRTNTLKITRDDLVEQLTRDGLTAEKTNYAPEGIVLGGAGELRRVLPFEQGLFQVQDESSMLVGHAMAPPPGSQVFDAASAPGGKTTHIAQIMGNQGSIVAADIHLHRLRLVEDNCRRLGITCVRPVKADARKISEELQGWADFVLLDAPCSGTGVIRRKPDSRWRKNPGQLPEIVGLQKEMLESVSRCLRPGGVLVYSTCSVLYEENQGQISSFLQNNRSFRTEDLTAYLPSDIKEREALKSGYLQLYPHKYGTDGFFIARLRKQ